MAHVFSNSSEANGSQRISPQEAKELIRGKPSQESDLPDSVTVQDMAELLGLPVWQVEQKVAEIRTRSVPSNPVGSNSNTPIPAGVWVRTQLWKWALAAVIVIGIGMGSPDRLAKLTIKGWGDDGKNRTTTDGIYDHASVALGRQLGMQAPPGFSYKIKYGTLEASANGDSVHYIHVDNLSKANLDLIQEQYTRAILDGFSKAVAKTPPEWINGKAVAIVKPNYYNAKFADPLDITLQRDGFPYPQSPKGVQTSPAAGPSIQVHDAAVQKMHDDLLQEIKDHWNDITD